MIDDSTKKIAEMMFAKSNEDAHKLAAYVNKGVDELKLTPIQALMAMSICTGSGATRIIDGISDDPELPPIDAAQSNCKDGKEVMYNMLVIGALFQASSYASAEWDARVKRMISMIGGNKPQTN